MLRPLRAGGEALRTAVVDLSRRPLFALLSVAAMAAAMLVLAAFVLLSHGARDLFARLAEQAVLEVYLARDAAPDRVESLAAALRGRPGVRRVERVTPERALEEFTRLYPDLADVQSLLGGNPLPGSLRVALHAPNPEELAELVRLARAHSATRAVRSDREWLESLARLGEALRLAALSGSIVLLLTALVTVGSVARLALDDKLDEVALLRLVGAPVSYVLAPVLVAGGILGGVGAVVAVALVWFGRTFALGWSASTPFAALCAATLGQPPPAVHAALLALLGVAAGATSAACAAGRAAFK